MHPYLICIRRRAALTSVCSAFSVSVGPLHSDRQYDIGASKEGFVLSPVEGTEGDFKAFALAGVTFKVGAVSPHFYVSQVVGIWSTLNNQLKYQGIDQLISPLLSLSCIVDQIRRWSPFVWCPPVFKWSAVSLQPADPGHWSAYLQQPGRDPAISSFAVTVVIFHSA